MAVIFLLLLIGALVCFGLAAFNVALGNRGRGINLVALGLALWVLVEVIKQLQRVL